MKILLQGLILIFYILSFNNIVKADNISDFEIEGMSIGDSLLNFLTLNEIQKLPSTIFKLLPNSI